MLDTFSVGKILLLFFGVLFLSRFIYQLSGEIFNRFLINEDNEYNTNLSQKVVFLVLIAIILLISSIIAVPLFTRSEFLDFFDPKETGYIGDTIGGITNPFINSAAVIVTGLAFYMQYKANKLQVSIFKKQLDEAKKQFNIDQQNQRKKNQIEQIETQFYEMLKLHKSNIDELEYMDYNSINIKGRRIFENLNIELIKIYKTILLHSSYSNIYTPKQKLSIAYKIFFYGLWNEQNGLYKVKMLKRIYTDTFSEHVYLDLDNYIANSAPSFGIGHAHELSHIYRHLFLTVKFIATQAESLISYEQKRTYLRILRAQLSNYEQAMLFYNWYSGFGEKWEQEFSSGNKFFTEYRMIHNLYNEILHSDFKLENIFDLNKEVRKEIGRYEDFLFEFQG
ncbi:putative phage abortive infection protein [uncultured Chryseobacterium sp.]|uniref:putative phage abortive infection protein n=1 Tax=uncultured Chryseobacterium sp. TaxID=259322 RepID=UPI0037489CDA